ncbi:hypothetical protein ACJRO7_030995 [Eucalyptus globulus]|uniref:Uncharacterized protein n=1 Tax=Eucalyptus globulus TaxID=34317 RepID=A0ABD3JIV5_EUCGL
MGGRNLGNETALSKARGQKSFGFWKEKGEKLEGDLTVWGVGHGNERGKQHMLWASPCSAVDGGGEVVVPVDHSGVAFLSEWGFQSRALGDKLRGGQVVERGAERGGLLLWRPVATSR